MFIALILQPPLSFATMISTFIPSFSQLHFLFQVRTFAFLVLCFLFQCFVPFFNLAFSVSFLMESSDIRHTSPSVAFFFARLGAFIGYSSGLYPPIRDFTLSDSSLSLVLGDLYPLLCKSLSWFESV